MSRNQFRYLQYGVAVLFGLGLFSCRGPVPVPNSPFKSEEAVTAETLDQQAWEDFQAAQAEFNDAWRELESLKLEAQKAKVRVEAVRQQLAALEAARASEVEVFKGKAAALEASSKHQR